MMHELLSHDNLEVSLTSSFDPAILVWRRVDQSGSLLHKDQMVTETSFLNSEDFSRITLNKPSSWFRLVSGERGQCK